MNLKVHFILNSSWPVKVQAAPVIVSSSSLRTLRLTTLRAAVQVQRQFQHGSLNTVLGRPEERQTKNS